MNKLIKIETPNRFGALDAKELKDFEISNDIVLPEDYKAFLMAYNGGQPIYTENEDHPLVKWFYGFHEGPLWSNIYHAIDVYHNRIPSWYLPIACDPFGNLFLMSLYPDNYGLVTFWDHETEAEGDANQYFDNMRAVADSFTLFIKLIFC